jgi:hypothetical protein
MPSKGEINQHSLAEVKTHIIILLQQNPAMHNQSSVIQDHSRLSAAQSRCVFDGIRAPLFFRMISFRFDRGKMMKKDEKG